MLTWEPPPATGLGDRMGAWMVLLALGRLRNESSGFHTARNSHPETGPSDPCEQHRREMVTHGNGQ